MLVIRYQAAPDRELPPHVVVQWVPLTRVEATTRAPLDSTTLRGALPLGRVRAGIPSHRAASTVAAKVGPGTAAATTVTSKAAAIANATSWADWGRTATDVAEPPGT